MGRSGTQRGLILAILLITRVALSLAQAASEPGKVPETLTLEQAVARAQANEPVFAAARAEQKALALDRTSARVAMLPTAIYHNQAIYTQHNGVPASRIGQTADAPSPIFIANNAVREYASQALLNETIGVAQFAAIRLADAHAARAAAELEVARRGLIVTVVTLFQAVGSGRGKLAIANEAAAEADDFLSMTRRREQAREAAHADVLKASLQQQQRQRESLDAAATAAKAQVELGALLYPDPVTEYRLQTDDPPVLPSHAEIDALATRNNPEIRSAQAAAQVSAAETSSASAALLPELALNFTYGIDATNFGVNGPDGIRNLGYSMSATLGHSGVRLADDGTQDQSGPPSSKRCERGTDRGAAPPARQPCAVVCRSGCGQSATRFAEGECGHRT